MHPACSVCLASYTVLHVCLCGTLTAVNAGTPARQHVGGVAVAAGTCDVQDGVHQQRRAVHLYRCIPKLPFCPVCRFPNGGRSGHCKKGGLLRTCARRNAAATPSRFVVSQGLGSIGPAECPSIHAQATPGSFDLPQEFAYYDDGDYDEEEVPEDNVFDAFPFEEPDPSIPRTTLFASVSTPEEFQTALREGVIHIVVTQHLDMVDSETEPDLQPPIEALNNAVGRLSNTTLSIVVRSAVQHAYW